MADANLAEYTKQVSAAGMAMDKDFGTAMQKTYVKVVAFNKILGPFYNLWLKFKTGVGALLSPMKALLVPFGIMEKTVDGIRMSFLSMIGILFTVISVFAYLTSSVGSAGGGTNELMASLGGLKDILLGVIQQIMAFDFGPAIEMAKGLLTEFGSFFVSVVTLMVDIIGLWLTTWLGVIEAMYDHGVFHALLAVFMGVWTGISAIFDGFMEAFESLGISGGDITSSLSSAFGSFASFLVSSGIIDFFVNLIETFGLVLQVAGVIIGELIVFMANLAMSIGGALGDAGAGGAFMTFMGIVGSVITFIITILNGLVNIIRGIMSTLLRIFTAENPFTEFKNVVGEAIDSIVSKLASMTSGPRQAISDGLDSIMGLFQGFLDFVLDIFDKIPDFGDVVGGVSDFMGSVGGAIGGAIGFSKGGVVSGPSSGFPAILHGTEAVVPLPDGRSIPVAIQGGGGGGGSSTFNITVNGAKGDPQQIAKAVGKEVQRVFKSRSRSGGYGRGI